MSDIIIISIISLVILYGITAKTEVFPAFLNGAKNGLHTLLGIFPSVLAMMVAVNMLRASGALDLLTALLSPVMNFVGIPAECVPLALLKPISGGGALAIGADVIKECGVDSIAGMIAAAMLASSDTTFFVISVYFGSLKVRKTRYALICSLLADITAFIAAAFAVRVLMT